MMINTMETFHGLEINKHLYTNQLIILQAVIKNNFNIK
jgi:hypothetical protein